MKAASGTTQSDSRPSGQVGHCPEKLRSLDGLACWKFCKDFPGRSKPEYGPILLLSRELWDCARGAAAVRGPVFGRHHTNAAQWGSCVGGLVGAWLAQFCDFGEVAGLNTDSIGLRQIIWGPCGRSVQVHNTYLRVGGAMAGIVDIDMFLKSSQINVIDSI